MANIALIIAGGVGARMGQDIPKQFINVNDRPVIIYTLEAFQKHPEIDAIEVVCLDGWHDVLKAYAKQFGIAKLENIVSGGLNGQDSIRNGLLDIYNLSFRSSVHRTPNQSCCLYTTFQKCPKYKEFYLFLV